MAGRIIEDQQDLFARDAIAPQHCPRVHPVRDLTGGDTSGQQQGPKRRPRISRMLPRGV